MAKRIFELPKEHELTKEQRQALRLPKEGQYLIFGAPGTGKSIVALMRLKKYADFKEMTFITYNRVLNHASKSLLSNQFNEKMHTGFSWIEKQYFSLLAKNNIPKDEDKSYKKGKYQFDYNVLSNKFSDFNAPMHQASVIIDEGQDFPVGWYESLQALNIENFFVVADQNQQLTEENSNHQELKDLLALSAEEIIYLKENWRNTTPIAVFSNYFYTDKTSPLPKVPFKPSAYIPILYEYTNIEKARELIWAAFQRDNTKLIGVIVSNNKHREVWYQMLNDKKQSTGINEPVVFTYVSSSHKVDINFEQGGVVVLNDKSVKGLEFDEVFIIDEDFNLYKSDEEFLKKRMYVMSSRAKERLFILRKETHKSALEKILPTANTVIKVELDGQVAQFELLKRIKL